jgi:predicted nuclease with TOPRIM domain
METLLFDVLAKVSTDAALFFFLIAFFVYLTTKGSRFYSKVENLEKDLHDFKSSVDQRFEKVDERFDKVDERFDKVDGRFNKVDDRFDRIDAKFERLNDKLDNLAMYLLDNKPDNLRKTK